jgi:hypothetical protein
MAQAYLDGHKTDPRYAMAILDNPVRTQYIWGKTELLKPKEPVKRYEAALALNTLKQQCFISSLAITARHFHR